MNYRGKLSGIIIEPSMTFDGLKNETIDISLKYCAVIAAIFSTVMGLFVLFETIHFELPLMFQMVAFAGAVISLLSVLGWLFPPALYIFSPAYLLFMDKINNLVNRIPEADAGIEGAILRFIIFLIIPILSAVINGAFVHLGVRVVGGKKGIIQTMKAFLYGSIPVFLVVLVVKFLLILSFTLLESGTSGGELFWFIYYSPDYFTIIWSFVLVAIGIRQLQEIRTWRAVLAILIPFIILGLVYGVTAFVLYGHWTSVIEFLV